MKTKNWLIEKRKKYGLSQSQLAQKIGLSKYTIENIEQEKRLGSVETWNKIESFFKGELKNDEHISYENSELIKELKQDILEFGEDKECILVYKIIDNNLLFTNYDFVTEQMPFDPKTELKSDEKYIITTFKYALEVFEEQNKLL